MMTTNNVKLSILSVVPLTMMDHTQVGLVVVALLGMNMNHLLAKYTVTVSATEDHSE